MLPEPRTRHGLTIAGRSVATASWWADKAGWGEGAWTAEPDKAHWLDTATGLDCLAVRHDVNGHWCGYVGVPEGHPRYGAGPEDLGDLEVHGGANYGRPCQEAETDEGRALVELLGVCHAPEPGRPERVFWVGFDCSHAWDAQPARPSLYARLGLDETLVRLLAGEDMRTYRDLEYVMAECERLARQLA